jgi:hypothetical protein
VARPREQAPPAEGWGGYPRTSYYACARVRARDRRVDGARPRNADADLPTADERGRGLLVRESEVRHANRERTRSRKGDVDAAAPPGRAIRSDMKRTFVQDAALGGAGGARRGTAALRTSSRPGLTTLRIFPAPASPIRAITPFKHGPLSEVTFSLWRSCS